MKRVFVLGAGVSSSAGLPLAAGLLESVAESQLSPSDIRELHKFLKYISPIFDRHVRNYPDVEEFLTLLDVAESYASFASARQLLFSRRRLSRLKRAFLSGLARLLWTGHEEIGGEHPIASFARRLGSDDTVITFNYDLTIEYALYKHTKLEHTYDYPAGKGQVLVLKPHGSIDWFLGEDVYGDRPHFTDGFQDLSIFDGWRYEEDSLSGLAPLIVPPVGTKLIEHRDLQSIWQRIGTTIRQAEQVYIVGYSLPEADRLTRYVLRRAIGQVSDEFNVTVVNPGRGVIARFREQIHDRIASVPQLFERWVEELESADAVETG